MSHKNIITLYLNHPMDNTSITENTWDTFKIALHKEAKRKMKSVKWNFGHFVVMHKDAKRTFEIFVSAFNHKHKVNITISEKP